MFCVNGCLFFRSYYLKEIGRLLGDKVSLTFFFHVYCICSVIFIYIINNSNNVNNSNNKQGLLRVYAFGSFDKILKC